MKNIQQRRTARVSVTLTCLVISGAALALGLPKPPKPGELPEIPDTQILDKLPKGVEMPEPGEAGLGVSCLQKGKMDITRPSLPLLSCWESMPTGGDSAEDLQKACTVQMTPMQIDSQLVPKCPPAALGTCIGARSGGAGGEASLSNHHHYTPQSYFEWKKSKKNCERLGGKWYGLGNQSGFF